MDLIRRNAGTLLLGALGGAYSSVLVISYLFFDELPRDAEFFSVSLRTIASSRESIFLFWSIFISFTLLGLVVSYAIALLRAFREVKTGLIEAREVNKVKDEFISMVLHHLRTPLSGIKWSLKEILKEPKSMEDIGEELKRLLLEGERALQAVDHLVEAAQASMGRIVYNFKVVSAREFYEDIKNTMGAMQSLANERRIAVEVRIADSAGRFLKIDREKIIAIVQLLFENAVKYSEDGRRVRVYSEETPSYFLFHIIDQGLGIPDQEKPKIFLQFFRGDRARRKEPSGFGIGLFLAKTFLGAHGGSIWFVSKEGEGSSFSFRLPLIKSQSEKYLEKL
jgi:two-component system sensor histidine kinase ResE